MKFHGKQEVKLKWSINKNHLVSYIAENKQIPHTQNFCLSQGLKYVAHVVEVPGGPLWASLVVLTR